MYRTFSAIIVTTIVLAGCGGEEPAEPTTAAPDTPESAAPAAKAAPQAPATTLPPMRNFAAVTIGPYNVQPMFEEEIENGHYNLRVSGGEVKAIRIWVGPEDASGVMVVKTEIENDYNHGHIDVPKPIPADATLWIEIEDPSGALHKGSTPLKQAS